MLGPTRLTPSKDKVILLMAGIMKQKTLAGIGRVATAERCLWQAVLARKAACHSNHLLVVSVFSIGVVRYVTHGGDFRHALFQGFLNALLEGQAHR